MKIVSYNLRYGGNSVIGPENHWQRLIRDFDPDIVFAQESVHPERYFSPDDFAQFKGCLYCAVPHGMWGSAILSRNHQLESIPLPEFDGWVVGARVPDLKINGLAQAALIFSLHAPSPGPYEPIVNRILDAIAQRWDGTPMIIAGDFNVTTAIRHPSEERGPNSSGERKILERLRTQFGMSNAWQALHPNENLPQTLRWSRDPLPYYHCDAVFVSHSHLRYLASAKIDNSGDWGRLSDHNPILVTFK